MTESKDNSPDSLAATHLPHAGLLRRIAAMVYDSFLVFALCWAVTAAFIACRVAVVGEAAVRESGRALQGLWAYSLFVALLASIYAFYLWFWTHNGQTLGMQAWRIRLDQNGLPENQRVSRGQATKRFLAAGLSMGLCGLGYLWILLDKDRLAWHDRISDSCLVVLPKAKKR